MKTNTITVFCYYIDTTNHSAIMLQHDDIKVYLSFYRSYGGCLVSYEHDKKHIGDLATSSVTIAINNGSEFDNAFQYAQKLRDLFTLKTAIYKLVSAINEMNTETYGTEFSAIIEPYKQFFSHKRLAEVIMRLKTTDAANEAIYCCIEKYLTDLLNSDGIISKAFVKSLQKTKDELYDAFTKIECAHGEMEASFFNNCAVFCTRVLRIALPELSRFVLHPHTLLNETVKIGQRRGAIVERQLADASFSSSTLDCSTCENCYQTAP